MWKEGTECCEDERSPVRTCPADSGAGQPRSQALGMKGSNFALRAFK